SPGQVRRRQASGGDHLARRTRGAKPPLVFQFRAAGGFRAGDRGGVAQCPRVRGIRKEVFVDGRRREARGQLGGRRGDAGLDRLAAGSRCQPRGRLRRLVRRGEGGRQEGGFSPAELSPRGRGGGVQAC